MSPAGPAQWKSFPLAPHLPGLWQQDQLGLTAGHSIQSPESPVVPAVCWEHHGQDNSLEKVESWGKQRIGTEANEVMQVMQKLNKAV